MFNIFSQTQWHSLRKFYFFISHDQKKLLYYYICLVISVNILQLWSISVNIQQYPSNKIHHFSIFVKYLAILGNIEKNVPCFQYCISLNEWYLTSLINFTKILSSLTSFCCFETFGIINEWMNLLDELKMETTLKKKMIQKMEVTQKKCRWPQTWSLWYYGVKLPFIRLLYTMCCFWL